MLIEDADLCLVCSGSLPSSSHARREIFFTSCCAKPICPKCIRDRPQLARYKPCLACLTGVGAVASSSGVQRGTANKTALKPQPPFQGLSALRGTDFSEEVNIDGSLRDGDVFVVGDEDEEDELDQDISQGTASLALTPSISPPPAYIESVQPAASVSLANSLLQNRSTTVIKDTPNRNNDNDVDSTPAPRKHYIQKSDTLLGIALKYGVNERILCKLNNLPLSTLSTTPRLLHTRSVVMLPPSAKVSSFSLLEHTPPSNDSDEDCARKRTAERAAKRFQLVTKEQDWRIAHAYVALASSSLLEENTVLAKEMSGIKVESKSLRLNILPSNHESGSSHQGTERTTAQAIDAYLDDNDWEDNELASGRKPPSSKASISISRMTSAKQRGWFWNFSSRLNRQEKNHP